MHYAQITPSTTPPPPPGWSASSPIEPWRPERAASMPAWLANSQGDRLFVDMLHAFRPSGGLARESELAGRGRLGASSVAELQGGRAEVALIRFDWGDAAWLPLFQFEAGGLSPHPAVQAVVAELQPVYDGWSLANWFAQPNTWLADQRPVDLLAENPARVLEAARVDRFIVAG